MPYWRLFYHVVWSTKERLPLIDSAWEVDLYGYIWGKASALGCIMHAIGGMSDHLHIVISVPPKASVATIIGKLKGACSHYINEHYAPEGGFAWQSEYSVLTISEADLPKVAAYVKGQKYHHAEQATQESLEHV